mgnify:CR=1 FL=1
MENNNIKKQNVYISEEEKTINWEEIQNSFKKTFGSEIYNSWLLKISLVKEYNDYLVLGVPTRFFRDWIVSRYLDKILEQVKSFKLSINRIEFKIIEENKKNQEFIKIDELNKVTEIKDSILNYNRLNPNLNFRSFIKGKSNEIALSYSKKVKIGYDQNTILRNAMLASEPMTAAPRVIEFLSSLISMFLKPS